MILFIPSAYIYLLINEMKSNNCTRVSYGPPSFYLGVVLTLGALLSYPQPNEDETTPHGLMAAYK